MASDFCVSFVGGGNMACAIIDAIIASEILSPDKISVFDPAPEQQAVLRAKGVNVMQSINEVAAFENIMFLAVKPQIIDSVLSSLKGNLKCKAVVSIAAGISVEHIKSIIGSSIPIIRALPNTPMLTLNGMTVVADASGASDDIFSFVLSVFSAAGEVSVLPEEKINEAIPLSSSSPAFFFRMLKAMAEAGESFGIPYKEAFKLSAVAMKGSAEYALKSERSLDELIRQVSSPGGTTVAALSAFDDYKFEEFISEASNRCVNRAYELGKS